MITNLLHAPLLVSGCVAPLAGSFRLDGQEVSLQQQMKSGMPTTPNPFCIGMKNQMPWSFSTFLTFSFTRPSGVIYIITFFQHIKG